MGRKRWEPRRRHAGIRDRTSHRAGGIPESGKSLKMSYESVSSSRRFLPNGPGAEDTSGEPDS